MTASAEIASLVASEVPDRLRVLATALESGLLGLTAGRARIQRIMPPGRDVADRVVKVLEAWSGLQGAGPVQLGQAIRAAVEVRLATEARGTDCELAWTGPVPSRDVRATGQVVEEMLRRCRRDVLIVQYAVNLGEGTSAILDQLGALSRDGVRVTIILDARWGDGRGMRSLRKHWPERSPRPTVFDFTDTDDEIAKLHAKVLLVDRREMLVTSANLTSYGMRSNIEFGVRVQGDPASRAHRHFMELVDRGLVTPVGW